MLNLKTTAVAVLAFASSAAFAGTMGPVCTPGSVTVPCEHSAWSFAGQALYLQPTGVSVGSVLPAAVTPAVTSFDDNWDWGFKIEAAYQFGTGNDLNVNWSHFDNDTTSAFDFTGIAPATFLTINPKWDAVNVEFGQHVDFGDQQNIRFHGGLQWARLERNFTGSTAAVVVGTAEAKFDGVGPRVGADMSYDLGNGFGVYGNGAVALLVGDNDFASASTITGFVATSGSSTTVVPAVDAKLGATYTYQMAQGDLSLDAGYMWVDYISGLDSEDFAFHGPFVGLKWVGNVI